MTKEKFLELLKNEVSSYKTFLETADNQWIVKGFVDVDKNVYTISNDTKVVSKIIEILLIPKLDVIKDRTYYTYGDNKTEQAAKRYWDEIKK